MNNQQTKAILDTLGAVFNPNYSSNPGQQNFTHHNNRGGFRNFRGNSGGFDNSRSNFGGRRGRSRGRGSDRGRSGFSNFRSNSYESQSQPINITIAPPAKNQPTTSQSVPPPKKQSKIQPDGERPRKNPKNSKNSKNPKNQKTEKPGPKPTQPAPTTKFLSREEWLAKKATIGMVDGKFPRERQLSVLFIGKYPHISLLYFAYLLSF